MNELVDFKYTLYEDAIAKMRQYFIVNLENFDDETVE
jgi:hypothetical protein